MALQAIASRFPGLSLEQICQLARTEQLRRSLHRFVRAAWHVVEPETPFVDNWHIGAICTHLEAVTNGRIRKLIINIPPGHMKSLIVGVFWPAWVWARRPGWRALFASYADSLAVRDSVKCRTVIESDWYRETFAPEWTFDESQNRKDYFQNTRLGVRQALSVGGKATGFRGDAVVVDDALNASDAHSKAVRVAANEWWDQTMSTRLIDKRTGVRVVIMQRLHEDDLTGHLLAQGGYEHLCLPGEFEPKRRATTSIGWTDPRTAEGEPLFEGMFPAEVLAEMKVELGPTGFAGQVQQRPQASEGGMFKRSHWRFWKPDGVAPDTRFPRPEGCTDVPSVALPSAFDEVIASWDCTFKDTDGTDFVAGGVIARKGAAFYVMPSLFHKRASFTDTLEGVRWLSAAHPEARRKVVEDKANGSAVIDTLKAEIPGILPVNPEGGKEARAAAILPSVEAGQVFLPEGAPWLERWVHEFHMFPNGRNDDLVDMLSQALIRMLPKRTAFAARFKEAVKTGKLVMRTT